MANVKNVLHDNPVETIYHDVEEIFMPRPGGMVDTYRRERARREAAEKEAENAAEPVNEPSFKAVKTTLLAPEIIVTNQVIIQANSTAMILPANPFRFRAYIVCNAAISISKDQNQALGGIGFPIPANTPFPVNARAQLWAFAAGLATVNTYAEVYAD